MERLNPLIRNHVAFCYEQLCRDYVRRAFQTFGCLKVGRQWAGNYEIDVAGVDADLRLNVVGECEWSHKKVGLSVYSELKAKIKDHKLPLAPNCRYLLFVQQSRIHRRTGKRRGKRCGSVPDQFLVC